MRSHPDRRVATLAQLASVEPEAGPFAAPGRGSADARMDLKLWVWRAQRAMARPGGEAARERLAQFDPDARADLWAGTVQDGVARGFQVALEEAVSLAPEPAPEPRESDEDAAMAQQFGPRQLRRKKDILVASRGARMRYSRKGGMLFVDRAHDLHTEGCIRFEDRSDAGTLDGFVARPEERARIFDPAFLVPVLLRQGPSRDLLVLEGRLGRGPSGFPCRITLSAHKDQDHVLLKVAVENRHPDHRLRIRFLGFPAPPYLRHRCTDVWEEVVNDTGGFRAATLVRACGRLPVNGEEVAVPGAQCPGWIEHEFELGP